MQNHAALFIVSIFPAARPALVQFNPPPDPINGADNSPRTLAGGTGTVSATGTLSISGGTIAITVTGNSTLNNLGTIEQTGTARAVRQTANGPFTLNNGSPGNSTASLRATGDDAFQANQSGASVTINNYGMVSSTGGRATNMFAITTGSNTVNNFSTGILTATGSDA